MTVCEIMQRRIVRARFADVARRFASDHSGATALEYGLLLALIGGAIIVGTSLVGGGMTDLFGRISAALSS